MKKNLLSAVIAFTLCFAFTGCPDLTKVQNKPTNPVELEKTLDERINGGSRSVDLSDVEVTMSAEVRSGITLKNADFGGYTLTIKAKGVTLENITNCNLVIDESVGDGEVYVDDCDFKDVIVKGGGANSIHFKNTKITSITVKKDNVRVVLEEKTEISDEFNVSASGIKIEAEVKTEAAAELPKIKTLTVSSDVTTVTLSGGSIKEVKVEQAEVKKDENQDDDIEEIILTPIITITSATTEIETVVVVDTEGEVKVEEVVEVVIDPTIEEEYKAPEGTKVIEVTDISFDISKVKTEYFQYNKFNGAGVIAHISYSNGTTFDYELSKDCVVIDDENFAKEPGKGIEITFEVTYFGKTEEKTIVINVTEVANKVEEAIDKLLGADHDVDGAIKLFKEAYEENPSDERALYYALSIIASVSTDESVADLLKNNLGFKNYPATMNALLGGDWLETYYKTYKGYLEEVKPAGDNMYRTKYVRCSIASES